MNKLLVMLFASSLLQGCLSKQNEIKEDVVFLQSAPICNTVEMCKSMWDAAGAWVDLYSPQGIDVYTEELIHSEEPEVGSEEMDITVTKVKQKDGSFKIIIDNACKRSLGNCSTERKNMIAFNQKLISFMSVKEKKAKEAVFDDNTDTNQWIESYTVAINKSDANSLSKLFYLPTTFIEKDKIHVLKSVDDVVKYLSNIKATFSELKGEYVKSDSIDVFSRAGRNLYVNIILNLYDADNTIVGSQPVGLHLIKSDKQWKLLSSGSHVK